MGVIGEFKAGPDVSYTLTAEKDGKMLYRAAVKEVVLTYDLKTLRAEPESGAQKITEIDFAGAVTGGWAVFFYNESRALRSTSSFAVPGEAKLQFLIGGLAPGGWDVWRNGWLEDTKSVVDAQSGVLHFEALAGSYFIRKTS